jgi:hypothetical protein
LGIAHRCGEKSNGTLRICGDYKGPINDQILNDSYLAPNLETVFAPMAKCKLFAKIDLNQAYLQVSLKPSCRDITTINTPFGLYRYKRLNFGIKTASHIFQRAVESVLNPLNIKGLIIYQDDILIGANDEITLGQRLLKVRQTLENAGLSMNFEKSISRTESVHFLGYVISRDGVKPDEKLTSRILDCLPPKDKKGLQRFLGLCQYVARCCPSYQDVVLPLTNATKEFKWEQEQQSAFDQIKNMLVTAPVIRIFDVTKASTLTTDASENCLSAILSQEDKPVAYFSKKLGEAEKNYSNIEREALAVVWGVERCRQFLLGTRFTIRTDHQPLEFLFGRNRELPKVATSRVMRWAIRLMAYDFDIKYIKGNEIPHVDALNRLEFKNDDGEECLKACHVDMCGSGFRGVISEDEIQIATKNDPVLTSIKRRILSQRWSGCSQAEQPFRHCRDQLSIHDDIVYRGEVITAPRSLYPRFTEIAHHDHWGIKGTLYLLKTEVWWPNMYNYISDYVKNCQQCSSKNMFNHQIHSWPQEEKPWSRVHMDHGQYQGNLILILVDAFSGWPEAIIVPDRSAATCRRKKWHP